MLVHLDEQAIASMLSNVKTSGGTYITCTHFPNTTKNKSIQTGNWRPVNLTKAPFNLPQPSVILGDMGEEKVLAVWELSKIFD